MSQIEFKNVTKEYISGNKVLDDVSFSIEKGEFIFIIGPSGAGKSTIIKLLTREEKPEEGQVVFNNQDISNIKPEEMPDYRRKIGVVYQDYKLLNSKTVYDNVAVSLEVVDSDEQEIKSVVPNVLSLVGLLDHSSYYPQELSGGEKQRVAIARLVLCNPDVILLDEPIANLDIDNAKCVMDLIFNLFSDKTIIITSHQPLAIAYSTRSILL